MLDALEFRMTHADRLARLEHVQNLQTLLLHAILDDMRPVLSRWCFTKASK
jgi:hypothetical protein